MSDASMPNPSASASLQAIAERFIDRLFAVILIWLGADKFANPKYTVGLERASPLYGFLATNGFTYALAVLEIVAAGFLLANRAVRYVGLLVVLLFVGTFSIVLTAPAITFGSPQGFPVLSNTGEFLLKDIGLAAAAIAMVAHDVRRHREAVESARTR
jgi:hypothetical protein